MAPSGLPWPGSAQHGPPYDILWPHVSAMTFCRSIFTNELRSWLSARNICDRVSKTSDPLPSCLRLSLPGYPNLSKNDWEKMLKFDSFTHILDFVFLIFSYFSVLFQMFAQLAFVALCFKLFCYPWPWVRGPSKPDQVSPARGVQGHIYLW